MWSKWGGKLTKLHWIAPTQTNTLSIDLSGVSGYKSLVYGENLVAQINGMYRSGSTSELRATYSYDNSTGILTIAYTGMITGPYESYSVDVYYLT